MKLQQVLDEIGGHAIDGSPDVQVCGITHDSRRVGPGDLFAAVRGEQADGNRFAADAVARGATAVLSASPRAGGTQPATWIRVEDERAAMARAAATIYGHADREMSLIGITGTNGKTTSAYFLESILAAAGRPAGVAGSVDYRWPGHVEDAARTTPEAPDLHRMLRGMAEAGCGEAILEVSSHALALRRVEGLRFRVAVFTNLTRDHLDFHRDLDDYFDAKAMLFEALPAEATAILNADDPRAHALRRRTMAQVVTFGLADDADLRLREASSTFDGSRGRLRTPEGEVEIDVRLPGQPNLWNAMAAAAAARALGVDMATIRRGVAALPGVPGRFQRVRCGQPFEVIVDFAHTDDALRGLLAAVRCLHPARVITLFGCGGDRDRDKRPLMGAAAARGSDVVVLTSDNPRGEDPESIADDAERGIRQAASEATPEVHRCTDRRSAIELALSLARAGDAVVIAGKGHESAQIIGDRILPFDDREICRELLSGRFRGGHGG